MSFSNKTLEFSGHKVEVCQWDPSPPWVQLIIDGKQTLLYPEDFIMLANFLITLKDRIEIENKAL